LKHIEVAEMEGVSQLELLKKLQPGSNGIQRLRHSNEIFGAGYGRWASGPEVMYAAAEMGLYETVRRLLEEIKVNVDIVGGHYGTTLQAAAAGGHEKIVQLCLDYGADINTISGLYGTALQAAAAEGRETIVQLLLEHGADINITGGLYYTALHAAVDHKHARIARTLLEHGADVNARDGWLGTALDDAKRLKYNQACIDLLLEYEAEDHPPIEEISELETDSAVAVSAEPEAQLD
jgi:ankyrin repeat protein